ncbi:thrombopoietin receptor isoform X2 [Toxotes jaculatrix]|uniref:thrombopoietin receptor isoform X2 n=1 Tax=Toxotes jaculatrix TaxID=941984 RepID=UPI001B3A979E|nr:thrombopoietin receptor isoform X2 [Toxotes jaculatrix]
MIPPYTMNLPCRWEILFLSLWIQVGFVPGMHCNNGPSREEVFLLKDEEDPKCFTRTGEDFTCFFETADNRTYNLLYVLERFPSADVFNFVTTHLTVLEHNTNTTLYSRSVSVEDQYLLDPPHSVSLLQNDQAGQLLVSWQKEYPKYCGDKFYRIRYSSKGLGAKTDEAKKDEQTRDLLDSLVPGEETEVQVTVRCAFAPSGGHWSSWSRSARAMVPQNADDVSLMCYTSDQVNITCQWNASRYGVEKEFKLFYKISGLSGDWTECLTDGKFTDLCHFHGDDSRKIRVKLSSAPAPLNRTFYTQEFTLNKTIKTSPPGHLKGALEKNKLCLKWDAPFPSLSAHLEYEVGYQTRRGEAWKMVLLKGPETSTCLDVSTGSQYSVKIRAKPNESVYSGYWSDWSDVLTGYTPTDKGLVLMLCIPVSIMTIVIIAISTNHSKLKQYVWPPVPNLDKVLQGFLTEINKQRWGPPLTSKQCFEDPTTSVVEIMSEDEVSELRKPSEESTQLLSPDGTLSSGEQVDGSPGTDVFPDYVTLNKDSDILCTKGNKHMYEKVVEKGVPEVGDELLQTCQCSSTDGSVCLSCTFLNHSYVPLSDRFDCWVTPARGPGNLYTNLPCS